MVKTCHRCETAWIKTFCVVHCNHCVCICWVANNKNLDVLLCCCTKSLALWLEDAAVCAEKISALHAIFARHRANKECSISIAECSLCIVGAHHASEKWECTVIKLHANTFKGAKCWRDLKELQNHWSVGTKNGTRCNTEKEAVANLAGCTGDGNTNGSCHAFSVGAHEGLHRIQMGNSAVKSATQGLQDQADIVVLPQRIRMNAVGGKPVLFPFRQRFPVENRDIRIHQRQRCDNRIVFI